jgi:hypothetical protein
MMRSRPNPAIHAIGCSCDACCPTGRRGRRFGRVMKGATRALFLVAILCAIPFLIARFVASIQEERR